MDFSSLWERVAPVLAALFSALLVINLLARRLPASTVARLETVAPRVANALRLLRAGSARCPRRGRPPDRSSQSSAASDA